MQSSPFAEKVPRLALAITLGFALGFTPFLTLQALLLVGAALWTRPALGPFLISLGLFSFLARSLETLLHLIGLWVLTDIEALTPIWAQGYHSAVMPLTRFNHSQVMGSLVLVACMAFPLYWFSKLWLIFHGEAVAIWFRKNLRLRTYVSA